MSVPSSHESRAQPTRSDPVVAASAPIIGGPLGERVARVAPPWSVLRVLILLATLGYVVGYFLDYACIDGLWRPPTGMSTCATPTFQHCSGTGASLKDLSPTCKHLPAANHWNTRS